MSNEIEIQVAVEMKRVTRESKCSECGKLFQETGNTMFKKAFSGTPICDECRNEIIEAVDEQVFKALAKTIPEPESYYTETAKSYPTYSLEKEPSDE